METNKITMWSLVSNAVLVVVVLMLLRSASCGRVAPCTEIERSSDTVVRYTDRTDTIYRTLAAYVPRVERVIVQTHDTIQTDGRAVAAVCADTVLYSDSIYRAREFKAIINDIITGNRIARRSVQWADLTPITDRTVTNTITVEKKPALIKVYLGADAGIHYDAPMMRGGLDIAPSAAMLIADRYMLDAGYYILGGEISAGVKVKLSFRK